MIYRFAKQIGSTSLIQNLGLLPAHARCYLCYPAPLFLVSVRSTSPNGGRDNMGPIWAVGINIGGLTNSATKRLAYVHIYVGFFSAGIYGYISVQVMKLPQNRLCWRSHIFYAKFQSAQVGIQRIHNPQAQVEPLNYTQLTDNPSNLLVLRQEDAHGYPKISQRRFNQPSCEYEVHRRYSSNPLKRLTVTSRKIEKCFRDGFV